MGFQSKATEFGNWGISQNILTLLVVGWLFKVTEVNGETQPIAFFVIIVCVEPAASSL